MSRAKSKTTAINRMKMWIAVSLFLPFCVFLLYLVVVNLFNETDSLVWFLYALMGVIIISAVIELIAISKLAGYKKALPVLALMALIVGGFIVGYLAVFIAGYN